MRIQLFPGTYNNDKKSMELYADDIFQGLNCVDPSIEVSRLKLERLNVRKGKTLIRSLKREYDSTLRYTLQVAKYRDRRSDTVYHITDHTYSYLAFFLPVKRTVITCHDLIPIVSPMHRSRVANYRIRLHFLAKISGLGRAQRIIVPSNATKRDIVKHLEIDQERIQVVYPGLNNPFYCINLQERTNRIKTINQGVIKLLHVGTNVYYKNLETLVLALHRLSHIDKKRIYILYKLGSEFSPSQQSLISKLKLNDRVTYLGAPDSWSCVNDLYNEMDLLIYPSLYEGFCYPVLEAMAAGLPVICSSKGSLGEVTGGAAVICEPEEPYALANLIMTTFDNKKLLLTNLENGFRNVGRFNKQRQYSELLQVYRSILS